MERFVHIAVPSGAREGLLTYKITEQQQAGLRAVEDCQGRRAHIKLRGRSLLGLVFRVLPEPDFEPARIKPIEGLLDDSTIIDAATIAFIEDVARYYRQPLGLMCQLCLPRESLAISHEYRLRPRAAKSGAAPSLFPWQEGLHSILEDTGGAMGIHQLRDELAKRDIGKPTLKSIRDYLEQLRQQGLIERSPASQTRLLGSGAAKRPDEASGEDPDGAAGQPLKAPPRGHQLNESQRAAVASICGKLDRFSVTVLHGVTGSGKTDVYLECLKAALDSSRGQAGAPPAQALVMIPEISLAPQLKRRLDSCLGLDSLVSHYKIGNRLRAQSWHDARSGRARVLIGTRSSVFQPFANLRLIIIDEEHSHLYKEDESSCYHARDVAIWRAQRLGIPVVLCSATPACATWHNLAKPHFSLASLPERVEGIELPPVGLIDISREKVFSGFSRTLLEAMQKTLDAGEQVMIYLNSRGYAPALYCQVCQQVIPCRNCRVALHLHHRPRGEDFLWCHRCLSRWRIEQGCPDCGSAELSPVGISTQQVEQVVQSKFPGSRCLRIDSDSAPTNAALQAALRQAKDGEAKILIGTQMLIKGHHFPGVALVAALQPDSQLFSSDLFARERLVQDLVQVAGRSGRESLGRVLIQTRFPDEPLYQRVREHDYLGAMEAILAERLAMALPPHSYLAIARFQDKEQSRLLANVERLGRDWRQQGVAGAELSAPVIPTVDYARKSYHAQAWLLAGERRALGRGLDRLVALCRRQELRNWTIDIDPVSTE